MKYEKSAQAVVICQNKILCTEEIIFENLRLSLPKGHIEKNEDIISCAIRECDEETGIKLCKKNFVKVFLKYRIRFKMPDQKVVTKYIYPVLFIVEKEEKPIYKEKRILKISYMDIDEFISKCSYDTVRKVAKKAKKYHKKLINA